MGSWWWEKLGLALVSRALISRALIQLSADGWSCTLSLALVWPSQPSPGVCRLYGKVNGKLQKVIPRGTFSAPVPVVSPCRPMPPIGGLQCHQVVLVQFPLGSVLLSSGYWCMQNFVCALQDWSLFPPVLWKFYNQIPWLLRSESLGIPSPFVRSPGWKSDVGSRTLTAVWAFLHYYCFPVCESPTWPVWDLSLLWLHLSYHLAAASSLSLDLSCLFLVGSSILLLMVVQ